MWWVLWTWAAACEVSDGIAARARGDLLIAQTCLETISRRDADYVHAQIELARVFQGLEKYRSMVEALREVVRAPAADEDTIDRASVVIGLIFTRMAGEDWGLAYSVERHTDLRRASPMWATAQAVTAELYLRLGDPAKAARALRKIRGDDRSVGVELLATRAGIALGNETRAISRMQESCTGDMADGRGAWLDADLILAEWSPNGQPTPQWTRRGDLARAACAEAAGLW